MSAVARAPVVLRDLPIGKDGSGGRLLVVEPKTVEGRAMHRLVFYRGTDRKARETVRAATVAELRELFESRPDVERRVGQSHHLAHAVGLALDLPAVDRQVARMVDYLESTGGGSGDVQVAP